MTALLASNEKLPRRSPYITNTGCAVFRLRAAWRSIALLDMTHARREAIEHRVARLDRKLARIEPALPALFVAWS